MQSLLRRMVVVFPFAAALACGATHDLKVGQSGVAASDAGSQATADAAGAGPGSGPNECGGKTCAPTEYCAQPVGACLINNPNGDPRVSGVCTPRVTGDCNTLFAPVCGCDDKTYSNACEASVAGASIAAQGACPTTPIPTDGGTFCSGSQPRLMINGAEVPLTLLSGKALALNCCDAGYLRFATGQFQAVFNLLWRFSPPGPAHHVDVSNLQGTSGIELDLGCDPLTATCTAGNSEEHFTTGFQGTIDYAPTSTGMDATYCVSVSELAATPHAVVHSLQIYAPNVASPY